MPVGESYACLNYGEAFVLNEIEEQSVCINRDIAAVLNDLRRLKVMFESAATIEYQTAALKDKILSLFCLHKVEKTIILRYNIMKIISN